MQLHVYAPSAGVCSLREFAPDDSLARVKQVLQQLSGIDTDVQLLALYSENDLEGGKQTGQASLLATDDTAQDLASWGARPMQMIRVSSGAARG